MRNTTRTTGGTRRIEGLTFRTGIAFGVCLLVAAVVAVMPAGGENIRVAGAADRPAAMILR